MDRGQLGHIQGRSRYSDLTVEKLTSAKPELRRTLWPVFVYSFLEIALKANPAEAQYYFTRYQEHFVREHGEDLRRLGPIQLKAHVEENELAKLYLGSRYRINLTATAFNNLIQFLEGNDLQNIVNVLQSRCTVYQVDRSADDRFSLAAMLEQANSHDTLPPEDEGIPGHHPGSANTDPNARAGILPRLKLGGLPMEPALMEDVRADLRDEDQREPPAAGQNSLVEEWDQHIKREESEEAPARTDVPLPPSMARDVAMEVQKVKENRDRFKIEGRTGGVGPGVSVCMYTFHNTYDG